MLVVVTGMRREARIVEQCGEIVVAGGDNAALADKIETAVGHGARAIISFGICGGLAPSLSVGGIVIGTAIAWNDSRLQTDERWQSALSARIPNAVRNVIAGTNSVLAGAEEKAALFRRSGAIAADMESHVVARAAAAHNLPFAALRVVSDGAGDVLPPAVRSAIGPNGEVRIGMVLRSVAATPSQIPGLIRTARDSSQAFAGLLRCRNLLGIGLGCPYLG